MVRALLDGRKTQTRRIIKAPTAQNNFVQSFNKGIPEYNFGPDDNKKNGQPQWHRCRYGQPGDLLWVRESFAEVHPLQVAEARYSQEGRAGIPGPPGITYQVIYKTDGAYPRIHLGEGDGWPYRKLCPDGCTKKHSHEESYTGWTPSILMPRVASRLTLRNIGVRVERLQDIDEADAKAEGTDPCDFTSYVCGYAALWDRINGKGAWNANPWLWVVSFEVIKDNVAAVEAGYA
jgi:hypothetical protein